MLKAWTYYSAPAANSWYWKSGNIEIILLEQDDKPPCWRRVDNGDLHEPTSITNEHKGRSLPREHWPQWLLDMDEYYVDEGL